MLIDERAWQKTESVSLQLGLIAAAADHHWRHDRRPRRRPADDAPALQHRFNRLFGASSQIGLGQPFLVPADEPDAGGSGQRLYKFGIVGDLADGVWMMLSSAIG